MGGSNDHRERRRRLVFDRPFYYYECFSTLDSGISGGSNDLIRRWLMKKHSTAIMSALIPVCVLLLVGGQPAQGESIITEIIRGGLAQPTEVAVDAAGNVYIAGSDSNNAYKITPAGVVTEIITGAGDGAGNVLEYPYGIAVDLAGNVYVTGLSSNNAFKISPGGAITQIINNTGDGEGNRLIRPTSIAVDATGNVFVTGWFTNNAFKITPAGVITKIIDYFGDGVGNSFSYPGGITIDAVGNAYVAATASNNAFKITPAGVINEIIDLREIDPSSHLTGPRDVAVDVEGNVYVSGGSSYHVFKITPAGTITTIIDWTGDGEGNLLSLPFGIAVDPAGNAYVTGWYSDNAFKITPAGAIIEIINATGDGEGKTFAGAHSIAVDASGIAYVTGSKSNNAFEIVTDCNNNDIPDATDIENGTSLDANANGTPDECDCDEDEDCTDDLFCTGVEECVGSLCRTSGRPCIEPSQPLCDEARAVCVECLGDGDCDNTNAACNAPDTCNALGHCEKNWALDGSSCSDSLYCNGEDTCLGGACMHTGDPCNDSKLFCHELDDTCSDRPTFKLIYSNRSHDFLFTPRPTGVRAADDILTEAADNCRITALRLRVTGRVPGGGGSFTARVRLWDRCLAESEASVIPGTEVTFADLADDASIDHDLLLPMPNHSIELPPSFWIEVGFSTRRGSWYVGQPGVVGFSLDRYHHPLEGCDTWFGGWPEFPRASMNVEVFSERTCETSLAAYHAGPPTAAVFVPPNDPQPRVADDLTLAVDPCELRAYELSLRGIAGPYTASIDLREQLGDGPIPGTERVFEGRGAGSIETARFSFEPGIILPKQLWMTWQTSRPSTGATIAVMGGIGSSGPTYAGLNFPGFPGWNPTLTLPNGVAAIFALSVFCRADDTVGACCVSDGDCRMLSEDQCLGLDATFVGGRCLGDVDQDGVPDACDQCSSLDINDSDGDSVVDDCDACSLSDVRELLVVNACITKVGNTHFADGCTMSDKLTACGAPEANHGKFVSCVVQLTKEWRQQGLLEDNDVGQIVKCAAARTERGSPTRRRVGESNGRR